MDGDTLATKKVLRFPYPGARDIVSDRRFLYVATPGNIAKIDPRTLEVVKKYGMLRTTTTDMKERLTCAMALYMQLHAGTP